MVRENSDNKYNPFITIELKESEWNDIIMSFCIYGAKWARKELLPKLKEQNAPVPKWALEEYDLEF